MQETQIIPFTEVQVPNNWNYDESVKKVRPMVQKWTDMSYEFFLELKIAQKILSGEGWGGASGRDAMRTWPGYCEEIGISRRHAGRLIAEYFEEPFLYNIWNMPRGDDEDYFGHFPYRFMRNLLYYHTQENDLIYDPFAGSGVTIDVCQEMSRRYYCSDLFPQKEEIKQWDIAFGLPEDFEKPDFVFLDPPYWKQAEGKYSDNETDLSNMPLEQFNQTFHIFLNELTKIKVNQIAIIIQPTQYKNDFIWQDHIFDFAAMLPDYHIEMRYILPYSTQQYNAQMVMRAKEEKKCLCLNRDLVVWKINE